MVYKELNFIGRNASPRDSIKDMLEFCYKNKIYPITEEYSFEDFPKEFKKLEHGKSHFRRVVDVKEYAEKHGLRK